MRKQLQVGSLGMCVFFVFVVSTIHVVETFASQSVAQIRQLQIKVWCMKHIAWIHMHLTLHNKMSWGCDSCSQTVKWLTGVVAILGKQFAGRDFASILGQPFTGQYYSLQALKP